MPTGGTAAPVIRDPSSCVLTRYTNRRLRSSVAYTRRCRKAVSSAAFVRTGANTAVRASVASPQFFLWLSWSAVGATWRQNGRRCRANARALRESLARARFGLAPLGASALHSRFRTLSRATSSRSSHGAGCHVLRCPRCSRLENVSGSLGHQPLHVFNKQVTEWTPQTFFGYRTGIRKLEVCP